MAKLLILTGLFFIVAGLLWMAGDSLGLGISWAICLAIFPLPKATRPSIFPS